MMNSHAANDRVVETLIAASILGRQESGAEFTAEQIAHYFTLSEQPNPQVDEILAHTPAAVSDLLACEQAGSTKRKTAMIQTATFSAMNRKNATNDHSEQTATGLEQARNEALERLKRQQTDFTSDNHVE